MLAALSVEFLVTCAVGYKCAYFFRVVLWRAILSEKPIHVGKTISDSYFPMLGKSLATYFRREKPASS